MSSWTRIGGLATWVRTVEFDEYAECLSMLQGQPDQVWCTRGRARGRFTVAAIPITSVQVDLVGERSYLHNKINNGKTKTSGPRINRKNNLVLLS